MRYQICDCYWHQYSKYCMGLYLNMLVTLLYFPQKLFFSFTLRKNRIIKDLIYFAIYPLIIYVVFTTFV